MTKCGNCGNGIRESFNKNHPELMAGEKFITNCSPTGFKHLIYETKRMGEQAYTMDGKPLKTLYPVFVQISEVEKKRELYLINKGKRK